MASRTASRARWGPRTASRAGRGLGCTGPGCGPRSGPSWRARSRTGPGRHRQGRRLLVGSGDIAQGVGHGAGGLGDDGRVTPVGPGAPWGQVGDAPHRHPPAGSPPRCPCLWQPPRPRGPDGRGLVHDHQQTAVLSQALVQVPQPGLIVGQDLVEQRLTGAVQGGGPVLGLAHVDADEDINITDRYRHQELPSRTRPGASRSAADPAPTYALGLTVTAGRSPHQRSSSTGPGRRLSPPGTVYGQGQTIMPAQTGPVPGWSQDHQQGNGIIPARAGFTRILRRMSDA